jgi:hypothetical protein
MLMGHAPAGSRLTLSPRDNHITLPLQLRRFEQDVIDWLEGVAAPNGALSGTRQ